MIHLITADPIALDSPDHTHPWGVSRDNTKSPGFWDELFAQVNKHINYLDLGCAGGGLVDEAVSRGHLAVGLEGSNYWLSRLDEDVPQAQQWKKYHNQNLFTCDISRPFFITDDTHNIIKFDLISAWEVIEHIHPDRLNLFFTNIRNHLKPSGVFIGTVSMNNDASSGIELHQSIYPQNEWLEIFTKNGLISESFIFRSIPRVEQNSFAVNLHLPQ